VGQLFVKEHFPPDARGRVRSIIESIREALGADITAASWMSDVTRREALAKLQAITVKIGHPDRWRDYSGLLIDRGQAYENAQRARQFEVRRQMAKLGAPTDRTEWDSLPQQLDGYSTRVLNEIAFTAGLLQRPFFDPEADPPLQYGALGAVAGHELIHLFDDEGRKFDGRGAMRDWWTPEDARHYGELAQCFVDEYGREISVDDLRINGQLTLGENLADNGGLRLAYRASAPANEGDLIDGFTPAQRFFLAWAQIRAYSDRAYGALIATGSAYLAGFVAVGWTVPGETATLLALTGVALAGFVCLELRPDVRAEGDGATLLSPTEWIAELRLLEVPVRVSSAQFYADPAAATPEGDAIVVWRDTHPSADVRVRLVMALARAAGLGGMVGGQILDLAAEGRFPGVAKPKSLGDVETLQAMKTGALIRFGAVAGAILGEANDGETHALERYGAAVGQAFQIADDLLDIEGDTATVGKQTGKDAAAGKATIVGVLGVPKSKERLKSLVEEASSALGVFGDRADVLKMAARFVAERQT